MTHPPLMHYFKEVVEISEYHFIKFFAQLILTLGIASSS